MRWVSSDRTRRRGARQSFVRVRRVALQSIHHSRLGGAQSNPIPRLLLQRKEEGFASPKGFFPQIFALLEFDLEGEFADEGPMVATHAPERNIRLGGDAPSKIQDPHVLEHLLDDGVTDELDLLAGGGLDVLKRGKD